MIHRESDFIICYDRIPDQPTDSDRAEETAKGRAVKCDRTAGTTKYLQALLQNITHRKALNISVDIL